MRPCQVTAEAVASLASLTAQADVISPDLRTACRMAALAAVDTEASGAAEEKPAAAAAAAGADADASRASTASTAAAAAAAAAAAVAATDADGVGTLSREALGLVARQCARVLRLRASATLAIRDGARLRSYGPIPGCGPPSPLRILTHPYAPSPHPYSHSLAPSLPSRLVSWPGQVHAARSCCATVS